MEGDSLAIAVFVPDVPLLPAFVRERLSRGIPVTVGRQVELRRERRGWVDATLETSVERFRFRRDPWSGSYSATDGERTFSADSLGTIETWLLESPLRLPLQASWCGSEDALFVDLTIAVLPLTAEDLGEVEYWISGDEDEPSVSLLSIPRGLFGLVRDVTGLGDKRSRWRSDRFTLSLIASDWVWVRPISGSSEPPP
ncbi:MAG: hypothetical protein KC729_05890 [Candidatus Eisenbacteria bacterium]|uniref:Uncharacterized protein n=1 Tax=Eiseniibacteriota bacterium TaxID=2212470 RepID=A0A956RP83_UNCEI|nr:hypothetical protein [Candidatus Eisenbacteria bacterium]